ncbi:MAG: beta-galactosidase, partial [Verrucomicrobia bacterium]|nr:beta-galactosidase [Verrucomicrobiota bacterium]
LKERRPDGASFALPDLSCGEYFLDIWVQSPGGKSTQTWSSTFFTVTDEFVLGELSLKNTLINTGDKLEGALALPRALKEDEHLFLDLTDNFGRRILTQEVAAPATSTAFAMTMPPPLTTLHRIEARLMRGKQTVTRRALQFPVRCRRGWDDFSEVIWGGGGANNYVPQISLRKLTACDEGDAFDIGWTGATTARNVALANGWFVPYQNRYGCFGGSANHIIPVLDNAGGCMSQPATLQHLQKWGELNSSIFGPYGPFAWTHGDETHYSGDPDVCWCESCLEVFRNYLRSVYPDLAALNAEWKTAFANWKEIKPFTLKEAREKKVYAPWVEHGLANDRIFASFFRKSSEALAAHDPGNRAGFDGCGGIPMPNSGIDWWRLSRNAGILQDYFNNEESTELIRSFGRPDQLRGQWYGTYGLTWQVGPNTVPYCHFFPWNAIFHGMNSTWFWTMGSPGPLSGYAPDLTNLPFFASRTEALKTIKTGVGKLLLNSKRVNDGIAVHFSEASRIADALYAADGGDRCEAYSHALADVNRALEYAGLQYQYLSYEQVAQGELAKQGYKVFIMPHSRSVSDAECKAIREFAQNGGMVIADLLPAILNGHGTPQAKSLLADLFPSLPAEASAKAGDKLPIVNSIGKGKTALIGNRLNDCGSAAITNVKGWKALGDQSETLAALLAQAGGIQPAVRVVHRSEGKIPPTEITRFQAGSIQFVGLLRNYWLYDNNAHPVTITFPAESHLYDVLNGKYLGSKKEITGEISYRAQLYALSPYRVRALQIRGPDKCVAGAGASFTIEVRPDGKAAASKHVFRVEVVDPDGQHIRHYAANVLAENGAAEVVIPWALNDRPGSYAIVAWDVMSGVKAELRVKLTEAK